MGAMASQITRLSIVYSTIYSGADQIKHQSSASLAFVRRIHRWPVNSLHKWPVTQKMFPFDDVIMNMHSSNPLGAFQPLTTQPYLPTGHSYVDSDPIHSTFKYSAAVYTWTIWWDCGNFSNNSWIQYYEIMNIYLLFHFSKSQYIINSSPIKYSTFSL